MANKDVISAIDREISRLKMARDLLAGTIEVDHSRSGSARKTTAKTKSQPATAKRVLSMEARKRIAEGQKKRWAERKKK